MKRPLFCLLIAAAAVVLAPRDLRAVDLRADEPLPPRPPGSSLPPPPPPPSTPAPKPNSNNTYTQQTMANSPGPKAQAGGGPAGQRLQKLKQQLGLAPAQVAKIKPIFEKASAEIKALRDNTSLPTAQKRQKMRQIFVASFQQIRPILTPQQLQKWKQIREEHRTNSTAAGAG